MDSFKTGERRTVSVLFSDMKDSTALSERLDPEEMDSLMNRIFSRFEASVKRYDGIVEKYIGDALVAVFGVPTIHEDDPSRAVNAAMDFQEDIKRFNQSLKEKEIAIGFRMGIHTGLITTGKRGDYEVVTGHTMNVASRLESSASPNEIIVSEATKEECENDFLFSDGFILRLKGKGEVVNAYRIEGKKPDLAPDREPFLGREDLLDRIFKDYVKYDSGSTAGYLIAGKPGIGKTSLALQVIVRISQLPDFQLPLLYARARRYRKLSFSVVTDLLLSYLRFDQNVDPSEETHRLCEELEIERETAEAFTRFIREKNQPDNNAFVVLYIILGAIIKKHEKSPYPVMLLVDNIHHIDRQSRDFFQFFLKNARVKPFFLLAGRETHPVLTSIFHSLQRVELGPLDRKECVQLVETLWPENRDRNLADRILAYSEGNPLFIKEYVKFVRENRDSGSVPMTIQNIFLASLSKYEESMQNLLKKLSAFAHSFVGEEAKFIQEKTEGSAEMVTPALSYFLREGILIEENGHYYFTHEVFKIALYSSLLNHNKKLLHGLIAEVLMESKARPTIGILYHLVRAEKYAEAKGILLDEADRAYHNIEFLPYINIVIDHMEASDYSAIIQCLFMKSAILFNNGKTEGADDIIKQILRIAISQKNAGFIAFAYHLLGAYNLKSYCINKAALCGRKALSYYQQTKDKSNEGHTQNVLSHLALVEVVRNNPEKSRAYIESMKDFSEPEKKLAKVEAQAECSLLQWRYRDALRLVSGYIRELGENPSEARFSCEVLLSRIYTQLCDYQRLKESLQRLLAYGSSHDALFSQIHAGMGLCCYVDGEKARGSEHLRQAEYLSQQIRNDFDISNSLRNLALACYMTGNEKKAADLAQEGITIGLRHSSTHPTFSLLVLLVEIALLRGSEEEARFYLGEAAYIIEQNLLQDRKDMLLYHYFCHELEAFSHEESLKTALELLRKEEDEIRDEKLIENFHGRRAFGKVRDAARQAGYH